MAYKPRKNKTFFEAFLNNLFVKWHNDKGQRKNIHASDLLRSDIIEYNKDLRYCERELVLKNFYEQCETTEDPWAKKRFLTGWVLHEKWQALFEKYGDVVAIEEEVINSKNGYKIVFTPDAILNFLGKQWIVEIKGYKAETFLSLDKKGDPPKAAWHQCNLYMGLTGIHQGFVLVENKNTSSIKLWDVYYDEELAQPYYDRIERVAEFVKKHKNGGSLPKGLCNESGCERAQACSMREVCFDEELRLERLLPKDEWDL